MRREQPQKPLPPTRWHGAAEVHGDVVPVGEFVGDAAIARRVVALEVVQGLVGKHHAEAESVVGAVALVDGDLGRGRCFFIRIEK